MADSLPRVMGYEGAAARIYYWAFSKVLAAQGVCFAKRTKHPAKDPVSALLALGYNILHNNVLSLLVLERLNPAIGVLHSDKLGHAALASDMMEPFRAAIVDRVVWTLCLNEGLEMEEFKYDPTTGACLLSDKIRKQFIRRLDQKFAAKITDGASGSSMNYRRRIQLEIRRFKQVLMEQKATIKSFEVR